MKDRDRVNKKELWERTLEKNARRAYQIPNSITHSWEHTLNVVKNTKIIAEVTCPDHIKAAITAAYLHDIGRIDDSGGVEHALEGAKIGPRYYPDGLTAIEKETITFAIAHHADREAPKGGYPVTANFPEIKRRKLIEGVIATVWDADRLDLSRCRTVRKQYLSTTLAKKALKKEKRVRMKKPKFLYHGSIRKVDILMPHLAEDFGFGIYAASRRDYALAFALGEVPNERGYYLRALRKKDQNSLEMIYVRGHPNFGGKGYVYKLSSRGFSYVGGYGWICSHPVKPVKVVEIKVDDYLHLFRYATKQEKIEIEHQFG